RCSLRFLRVCSHVAHSRFHSADPPTSVSYTLSLHDALPIYNEMFTEHKRTGRREYWQVVGLRKEPAFATQCVGCGKCESHCPQHLPIRALLKEADRALRPPHYRVAGWVARKFLFVRKS